MNEEVFNVEVRSFLSLNTIHTTSFDGFFYIILQVVIFNEATEGDNYGNMEKVDTKFLMNVGRIRVIFLNRFVSNILVCSESALCSK